MNLISSKAVRIWLTPFLHSNEISFFFSFNSAVINNRSHRETFLTFQTKMTKYKLKLSAQIFLINQILT